MTLSAAASEACGKGGSLPAANRFSCSCAAQGGFQNQPGVCRFIAPSEPCRLQSPLESQHFFRMRVKSYERR